MPLAIVGGVFADAWNLRVVTLVSEIIKIELFNDGEDVDDPIKGFAIFGVGPHDLLKHRQFKATLRTKFHLKDREIRKVWEVVDKDESGGIDFHEFQSIFFPDVERAISTRESIARGGDMAADAADAASSKSAPLMEMDEPQASPPPLAAHGDAPESSMELRVAALDEKLSKLAASHEQVLASLEGLQKSVLEAIAASK